MPREAVVSGGQSPEDRQRDSALRPRWLREVVGQKPVVERLGIVLNSCKKRKEAFPHILFDGPPGLGKTTFATVLPNELGTSIQTTSGPALSKPADLLPFLTNGEEGSFLFIDEIHRLARRSRGTPRVANARLDWARHFATSEADGSITLDVAKAALARDEVDIEGLDKQDRRYLETLVGVFEGGPTGVEALAATMNVPADTLSDEIEPYLLREQFIIRTPRGRVATPRAYQLLGRPMRRSPSAGDSQRTL